MTLQADRIAKGLCPNCGAEAAPYRLCGRCRQIASIGRLMNKLARIGAATKTKQGREAYYGITPGWDAAVDKVGWGTWMGDMKEGDRRLAPRVRSIPVDVEKQIVQIITDIGRPCTLEEITEAWGRLRLRNGRSSAAQDVIHILAAEDRRKARQAKRAALAQRQSVPA